jgi:N-acetylglucosaminyl-diphospho-decaprenol L-rhamnosyltransferase
MADKALAVVIVSFNCREALGQCLRSLPPLEVVVVDNASGDGTCEMVRREFASVILIANNVNHGFAAGCNQGIRQTTGTFVLLLNPDTLITQEAIEQLLHAMDATHVGACGPRILNADGSVQLSCRRFPTLWRMLLAEFGVRAFYYVAAPAGDVDQLMGSCLLLRRAALEQIGLLDERFFVYFEEVDLCRRLKSAGWRVRFVADAVITHIGGQSSQHDRSHSLQYRYRSLFEYYRKHHPRWQLPILKLAVQVAALGRCLIGQREYAGLLQKAWSM